MDISSSKQPNSTPTTPTTTVSRPQINSNRILQWYCCSCGQSYGDISKLNYSLASYPSPLASPIVDEHNFMAYPLHHSFTSSEPSLLEGKSSEKEDRFGFPKRYNCHRCDHMMCPYCPKVRLKDVLSD